MKNIYESLKTKILENPIHNDTITFDLQRFNKELTMMAQESVMNILRAYNLYNTSFKYYQGLNYIVGFLLLFTQNETIVFELLNNIINKLSLGKLHTHNPLIKLKYYQMDRLVNLYLPQLAESFRVENIDSSHYVTRWLSTLFTNYLDCIQCLDKELKPFKELLVVLWDSFLSKGWKAAFKVAVYLLGKAKKEILSVDTEDVVCVLSKIYKKKIWTEIYSITDFKQELNKIKVTNSMLEVFEAEFNQIYN